jgi:type VI secretion system protein ImpG
LRDLLPYYEKELTVLRRHASEFAKRYPKIAARLLLSGEASEDPHIERLIESFAFLSARVQKKLDDEFPEITESLLEIVYPHYLRPFPSCSIAHFDADSAAGQLTGVLNVPRGTLLKTRPVKGIPCKFRTVYELDIAPVRLTDARFSDVLPTNLIGRVPRNAIAMLSLTIEVSGTHVGFDGLDMPRLRLFLDGEPSLISALRETLLFESVAVGIEVSPGEAWRILPATMIRPVGFGNSEGLIDYGANSHLAYRLLSEFFAFPEKFNFIDIDLSAVRRGLPPSTGKMTLHFVLKGGRDTPLRHHILERTVAAHFKMACSPVVNLFQQSAEPIRLSQTRTSYPVVVDSRRASAYELHTIESLFKVEKSADGEKVIPYRPFFGLRHGEKAESEGLFWHLRRDDSLAALSPGFAYEISIIDPNFDPAEERTETLSLTVTCTNRDLPSQLPYGLAGGDLFLEGGSVARTISFLRKPTPTYRIDSARNANWRLISHLALNYISMTQQGLASLKETLALYDLPQSPVNQRLIDGLISIRQKPVTARMEGNPFPTFVRGVELELTVDEQFYVGTGVHLFGHVLDWFFGLYVHTNSFTQLVLKSAKTGEELLRCKPRNGELELV